MLGICSTAILRGKRQYCATALIGSPSPVVLKLYTFHGLSSCPYLPMCTFIHARKIFTSHTWELNATLKALENVLKIPIPVMITQATLYSYTSKVRRSSLILINELVLNINIEKTSNTKTSHSPTTTNCYTEYRDDFNLLS